MYTVDNIEVVHCGRFCWCGNPTRRAIHIHIKGKAISLQACTDPEGSSRLRLPDFKTIDTRRW